MEGKAPVNYDKDPIIVFTPYTFEQMKEFQRYSYRNLRLMFFILIAVLAMYIIQSIVALAGDPTIFRLLIEDTSVIIRFLIIFFFVALLGIQSFGLLYTKKKHQVAASHQKDGQTYSFRNSEYDVEMHHSDAEGKKVYSYHSIFSATETKHMFYLYTGKHSAFLVDKQGFKNSSPEEFRQLLKKNISATKCKLHCLCFLA
jgi:hypothetical protein